MNTLVHSSFAKAKSDPARFIREAGDEVRNVGSYQLSIMSGSHEGAVLTLQPGSVQIGSGSDNDVILFADDIPEKHAELVLPTNALKDAVIKPLEGSVWLGDGSVVEVGQYAELVSGDTFVLGETEIHLRRFGDAKSVARMGLKAFAVICLIAILPLAYSLFSNLAVGVASAGSTAISALHNGINSQTERFLGADPETAKGQLDAFAWTARTKLEDLKLNHRIRVSTTATGSLRAAGNISDTELGRWTNFLQWYDSNPAFPPLIRDVNRVDLNDGLPKISSVWLDNTPSVVFGDGSIAGIGDKISDGWEVIAIEAGSVTVGRDGSVVSLTY